MIKDFKEISVSVKDLLLDPNNPRFSKHVDDIRTEDSLEDEDTQKYAFDQMIDDSFEIKELADSIKEKGFINVDKIFVRKINKKYLVIEGNRRITAIKLLLEKSKNGIKGYQLDEDIINSFENITCVDLTGESENTINLILGLRHHGSIKEWGLLPASFNLFQRYMCEFVKQYGGDEKDPNGFIYDSRINNIVADLFSIKESTVRNKVKAYRIFLQLQDGGYTVDQNKFSMIDETISRKKLKEFFEFNEEKCVFTDDGCDLFARLCLGVNGVAPIITAPASGSSSLRDFNYVIENGEGSQIKSIVEESRTTSSVKAEIEDNAMKRGILKAFEKICNVLEKIDFGSVEKDGYSRESIAYFEKIDKMFENIRKIIK